MAERVVVVGGGLAGLAAAQALTLAGRQVIVLESRQRLGGRAGSFTDATTGQTIDACQHVSMGCCDQLRKFFTTFGIADFFAPQLELIFRTMDGRKSVFRADRLPAPFHLARAFHRLHYLGLWDRLTIAWGLACLRFTSAKADPPFLDWLRRHHQTPRAIQLFWGLVLVSALNETVDRIGLRYARKVFVDGFLANRDAFTVQLPTVPLDRLYGTEMRQWFADRGCEIRLNAGVTGFEMAGGRVSAAILRDCSTVSGDTFVLAVPFERLPGLAPDEALDRIQNLKSSPITSVHLWYDRPLFDAPHEVIVDGLCQWVFRRGEVSPGEHYHQVVISAAGDIAGLGNEEIARRVTDELKTIYPPARDAKCLRSRVVIEKAATFSAVPGVDQFRPGPRCSVPNLYLAGDWTDTGWPATMEGAVRSGYRAAEFIEAGSAKLPL